MSEMDELIKDINELAHKQKAEGLTDEEKRRQQALRSRYIEIFRAGFKQELENIRVVDAHGNDVTPKRKKSSNIEN